MQFVLVKKKEHKNHLLKKQHLLRILELKMMRMQENGIDKFRY